jgi:hypothetical protein
MQRLHPAILDRLSHASGGNMIPPNGHLQPDGRGALMKKIMAATIAAGMTVLVTPVFGADSNWQPIDISKSNVSFVGDVSFIKSREWQRRSNGTQERLKFSGGEIFFEELYASGMTWQSLDRKQYVRDLLAKGLNKNEQKYQPSEVARRAFTKFDLD